MLRGEIRLNSTSVFYAQQTKQKRELQEYFAFLRLGSVSRHILTNVPGTDSTLEGGLYFKASTLA